MPFRAHLHTVNRHRRLVRHYCFKLGLVWQGLTHDLSKYSLAWLHHKGRNRHHFEYWIDYCRREDGTIYIGGCKMPKKYVAEMFCDRIAACRVYQGADYTDASPYAYYQRSKDLRRTDASRFMHPETAALLDRWLLLLKEQGEEAAFAAIRLELADDRY